MNNKYKENIKKFFKNKFLYISLISLVVYSFILSCFGIFGTELQDFIFGCAPFVLKYVLIFVGFFLCIFIPIRVNYAMELRKQRKYEYESNKKIMDIARQTKNLNDKIMQEYIKNEDAI